MPKTLSKKKTRPAELHAVQSVAAEDLRVGDYVTVGQAQGQLVLYGCDDLANPPRVGRITYIPDHAGLPRKVVAVAPPFVLTRAPDGQHATLDLRLTTLLRLGPEYAERAYKKLGPDAKDKKRKKQRK